MDPLMDVVRLSRAPTVLLASCAEVPDGDDDDRLGADAVRAAGVEVGFGVWDDPSVDWAAPDLVVVRSTWDYSRRHDDFLGWAAAVPRLVNTADVLAWNTDKHYLAALAAAGVPVVPTEWYAPGEQVPAPATSVVVKPTVSAGSRDTRRHDDPAAAVAHADELLAAGRPVMVQPYLEAVDTAGETGLVYLAGAYSHAFGKGALLGADAEATAALFAPEELTERDPTERERAVGEQVLDVVAGLGVVARGQLLYARVDLVPDADGEPLLLELELAEPSLFLCTGGDGALGRWADAVRTATVTAAARR